MEFTSNPLESFGRELLTIEVPSELGFKMPLVLRMARLLKENGYVAPAVGELAELCFDEALTNAMAHGNRLDPDKKVRVRLFADDERWGAIVEDEGEGFSPDVLLTDESEDEPFSEHGRGIMLMDGYLDDLLFNEKGNTVMMVRRREEGAEPLAPPEPEPEWRPPAMLEFDDDLEPPEPALAPREEKETVIVAVGDLADAEELPVEPGDVGRARKLGESIVFEITETRLTDANVDRFREQAEALLGQCRGLVFDMSKVTYISSVVLGAFARFLRTASKTKSALITCCVTPVVMAVFTSAQFHRFLDPQPTVEDAVKKLQEKL